MCLATGAPRRVGFANAREGSRYAYTHRIHVPDADRIHAVDRYWRVAEALGAGDVPKRFHVPLDPAEVNAARDELAELPRPWLAVAVGAKWVDEALAAGALRGAAEPRAGRASAARASSSARPMTPRCHAK